MKKKYIAALEYDDSISRKDNLDLLVDQACFIKLSNDHFSFVDLCFEESKYIGVMLNKVQILQRPLRLISMMVNT